jgi:hypothetical protein
MNLPRVLIDPAFEIDMPELERAIAPSRAPAARRP